jgi:hypothetical protein
VAAAPLDQQVVMERVEGPLSLAWSPGGEGQPEEER